MFGEQRSLLTDREKELRGMSEYCVGAPSTGSGDIVRIDDDEELSRVFRALAHPARLSLIRLLKGHDSCTGSEVFSSLALAQSTVSEHLRILGEAGLLSSSPSGPRTCYCLVTERLLALGKAVEDLSSVATSGRVK